MILTLAIFSGLFQLSGYLLYFKHVFLGKIRPNTAAWSIWTFGAILESASYFFTTNDLLKNILPITCTISAITFFTYCLFNGKFQKIDNFDKYLVGADLVITVIWFLSGSAILANILLVITAVVSFIPITRQAWRDPFAEDAKPWFLWSIAYLLLIFTVLFRWEKWEDLIYPITFFILHVLIAILSSDALIKRRYKIKKEDFKKTLIEHI